MQDQRRPGTIPRWPSIEPATHGSPTLYVLPWHLWVVVFWTYIICEIGKIPQGDPLIRWSALFVECEEVTIPAELHPALFNIETTLDQSLPLLLQGYPQCRFNDGIKRVLLWPKYLICYIKKQHMWRFDFKRINWTVHHSLDKPVIRDDNVSITTIIPYRFPAIPAVPYHTYRPWRIQPGC